MTQSHIEEGRPCGGIAGSGRSGSSRRDSASAGFVAAFDESIESARGGGEFYYEAGPCGYGVYREITEAGHDCAVVAPSLVPRKPGDRVKTDRRDALTLARLHRSGDLTPVWVPDEEQEAIRDLTRAREDMKAMELKAHQRLGAFLLRHGRVFTGKGRWTQVHCRWLEAQRFEQPVHQVVFQE